MPNWLLTISYQSGSTSCIFAVCKLLFVLYEDRRIFASLCIPSRVNCSFGEVLAKYWASSAGTYFVFVTLIELGHMAIWLQSILHPMAHLNYYASSMLVMQSRGLQSTNRNAFSDSQVLDENWITGYSILQVSTVLHSIAWPMVDQGQIRFKMMPKYYCKSNTSTGTLLPIVEYLIWIALVDTKYRNRNRSGATDELTWQWHCR